MNTSIDIHELRARSEIGAPTKGRPGSAALVLGTDGAALPGAAELAELLPRVPVAEVRLAGPADFADHPERTVVRIIALLRECASVGAPVTWSLALGADQFDLIRQLDHLPAPTEVTVLGRRVATADDWRSTHTFGLLYFRKGPDFLSVIDRRSGRTDRIVLDDPVAIDVFTRALGGCGWADLTATPERSAAAADLVRGGLILRFGDQCVTLPVHMRTWPLGVVLLGGTLAAAGSREAPERL
ncbi:MAG TPA: DUF5825 family protein [Pseudonocardiaceae bacterium]|jgi:hypothetical protein|nr:DUF5825 family protein [Pseudonocardiaceae bacterium]